MPGEYHGWDQVEDNLWTFANVKGKRTSPNIFVVIEFGNSTSREALSAVMAAMKQFPGRIHLRRTDSTKQSIDKLVEAAVLRVAPVAGTEHEELGVLGVRNKPKPKEPWWKVWKKA